MFKKLKEIDTKYSNLFFAFSIMIIIVFLVYLSTTNKNTEKNCVMPSKIVNNYTNYSYNIKYSHNEKTVDLFIKRYDSKYLIEKNENGSKSTYYLNYTDLLEKSSEGKFIKFRKDEIIEGLDNKYLIFDYINDISMESSANTIEGLNCYNNRKMELSICINLDNSVELKTNDFNIIYTIGDVGQISDFNVEIDNQVEHEAHENIIAE